MDRLKFVPRAGAHPRLPGKGRGDMPYFGRTVSVEDAAKGKPRYPATEEIASVKAGTEEATRLIQLCKRDGDVLPADAETAKAIGAEFVPLAYDGDAQEWLPAAPKTFETKRSVPSRKADD